MPDETIRCADCARDFTFTVKEQDFFSERGFTPPKRCRDCRQAKKDQRGGSGGGGGGGFQGWSEGRSDKR